MHISTFIVTKVSYLPTIWQQETHFIHTHTYSQRTAWFSCVYAVHLTEEKGRGGGGVIEILGNLEILPSQNEE